MLVLCDGVVITPTRRLDDAVVAIEGEKITYVGSPHQLKTGTDDRFVSVGGAYITPGFMDIHVNGGGGADAWHCLEDETALATISQTHVRHGTTSLVPTLITAPVEKLLPSIQAIAEAKRKDLDGARVLGALVEGPFVSEKEKGAHNPEYIRVPADTDWGPFLELADDIVMMTIAPEVEGGCELGAALAQRGVVPAVGHSHATFDQVRRAVDHGFTHVTHIFCSTPGYIRDIEKAQKISRVMEAALILDDLTAEIIGDGKHVPEGLLKLALKAKGISRLCAVTDAINATGLPPGPHYLGDMPIVVEDGVAKLADRSFFAGSVATMDMCVRNMMALGGITVEEAVASATSVPARIIGADRSKGRLAKGMDADVVVFDDNVNIRATIVEGTTRYWDDTCLRELSSPR